MVTFVGPGGKKPMAMDLKEKEGRRLAEMQKLYEACDPQGYASKSQTKLWRGCCIHWRRGYCHGWCCTSCVELQRNWKFPTSVRPRVFLNEFWLEQWRETGLGNSPWVSGQHEQGHQQQRSPNLWLPSRPVQREACCCCCCRCKKSSCSNAVKLCIWNAMTYCTCMVCMIW